MPGGLAMGLLGPSVGRWFDAFGGRVLVIPGAIAMRLALAGFTQVGRRTPYWQLLACTSLLMVVAAATFTPVFTLGLGALPPPLYGGQRPWRRCSLRSSHSPRGGWRGGRWTRGGFRDVACQHPAAAGAVLSRVRIALSLRGARLCP